MQISNCLEVSGAERWAHSFAFPLPLKAPRFWLTRYLELQFFPLSPVRLMKMCFCHSQQPLPAWLPVLSNLCCLGVFKYLEGGSSTYYLTRFGRFLSPRDLCTGPSFSCYFLARSLVWYNLSCMPEKTDDIIPDHLFQ